MESGGVVFCCVIVLLSLVDCLGGSAANSGKVA